MTRILFISSRADYGGGQAQMYDIISGLDRGRYEIYAAVPREEPFYGKLTGSGVGIVEIKKRTLSAFDLLKLAIFVRKNHIDIIHSHGKGAGIYSRLLKFFRPAVRVVHTFHGFHFDTMGPVAGRAYAFAEAALAMMTDVFVNVSDAERSFFIEKGIVGTGNSVVIRNGVSSATLDRIESAKRLKKFGGDPPSSNLYFCNVSRFDEVKEIPFLIRSFSRASERHPEARLILVGDGERFEECRHLAAELGLGGRIYFTGFRADALEIMARCGFYVSASRREGMPLSVIEAMKCGLVVLASSVPGHGEIVSGYAEGVLFEYKDEGSFLEGFEKAIDIHYRKTGGRSFINSSAAESEDYLKKYDELYSGLMAGDGYNNKIS